MSAVTKNPAIDLDAERPPVEGGDEPEFQEWAVRKIRRLLTPEMVAKVYQCYGEQEDPNDIERAGRDAVLAAYRLVPGESRLAAEVHLAVRALVLYEFRCMGKARIPQLGDLCALLFDYLERSYTWDFTGRRGWNLGKQDADWRSV